MKTNMLAHVMFIFLVAIAIVRIPAYAAQEEAPQALPEGIVIEEWIPATDEEAEEARGGMVPIIIIVGTTARAVIVKCTGSAACRSAAQSTAKKYGATSWKVLEKAATIEGARSLICRYSSKLC